MSKVKQIRPSLSFTKLLDADLLSRAHAVQTGIAGNPAYPNPPVDPAAITPAIANFTAAIAGALDGSKKAMAERNKHREDLIAMLRSLGHYVEHASKGDLITFLSSGFEAASTTRTAPQPLPQPNIVRVDQGNTGQLLVNIKPLPRARNYELRYAQLGNGGTPGEWMTAVVAAAKKAAPINGLTPGGTYMFQVRAFGKLGFTDWSSSVNRMCI